MSKADLDRFFKAIEPMVVEAVDGADMPLQSFAQLSLAISLKRLTDMMEEDRKPILELAPEGYVSDQEHRQILRDGLARDGQTWERIADALETAIAAAARRAET